VKAATIQRWGGGAAMLGGFVWIAARLIAADNAAANAWNVTPLLMIIALSLLLPGILALHRRWRGERQPFSTIAAGVAMCGVLVTVVDLLIAVRGQPMINDALFSPCGTLGMLAVSGGLLFLASLTMIDVQVPGWQSTMLLVGLVGLFLPLGAGVAGEIGSMVWIIWGLGWSWLGAILVIENRRSVLLSLRAR